MASDDIYNRPKGAFAKIRTILVGVLVGMLVLAFAVWGIEDVFSPNSSNAVIKVGEVEVGRAEFQDRFNDEMRRFAEENGEGLTPQQAFDRGIPQQLLAQLSQELAIEADSQDLGIGVNNRDVLRYVENIDAFQNEITQQFDRLQLRRLLANNRVTEAEFEQDVVNALSQRQTLPAIMGGITAPSDYAQRFNTFVNEIRKARVIDFGVEALDPLSAPTEAELQSYIAANQARFTAPEYRRFLMIRVEPFDFPNIEVTDIDLRQSYDAYIEDPDVNQAADVSVPEFDDVDEALRNVLRERAIESLLRERYETLLGAGEIGAAETRDVTVLAVPTQDQASVVAARITAGETVEAVAADLNLPAPDTFTGIKPDGLINPASSAAAFDALQGEARVAPTEFGTFDVITVTTINASDVPEFESMREELREGVLEGQALRRINDYERVIDDRLLEGATIEELAEDLNLPLSSYPYIDRSGAMQDGTRLSGFSAIPGIASDDRLLQAVFTSDIGFESDITPTSNNGLAIFRVTDIIDARPRELDEVRDLAAALWSRQQLTDALTQKGVELATRLREGESLEGVAEEIGSTVREIAIQRVSPPTDVSAAVTIGLLDGEVGQIARGPARTEGRYEIGVLDSISTDSERVGGQMLDIIRQNLSEQIALDISRAYQNAITTDKDQRIFEDQMLAAIGLEQPS